MALRDYEVERDHFVDKDDYEVNSFPCCCCVHEDKHQTDHPCRVCDHNVNAVKDDQS